MGDGVPLGQLKLFHREGWSVTSSNSDHLELIRAIVEDNAERVEELISAFANLEREAIDFTAETPNDDKLDVEMAGIGHLLLLFGTESLLENFKSEKHQRLFQNSIASIKKTLMTPAKSLDIQSEILEESSFRRVPAAVMVTINGRTSSLRWLINNRLINFDRVKDWDDRNMLHFCVENNCPEILEDLFLTTNIADKLIKMLREKFSSQLSVGGLTPFVYALKKSNLEIISRFLEKSQTNDVKKALTDNSLSVLNCVLKESTDANFSREIIKMINGDLSDYDKETSIKAAIENENFLGEDLETLVEQLLEKNALPTPALVRKLLQLPFRRDEIVQISKLLLNEDFFDGIGRLTDFEIYKKYEYSTLIIEIFKQTEIPQLTLLNVIDLMTRHKEHKNFPLLFSDVNALAIVIFESAKFGNVDSTKLSVNLWRLHSMLQRVTNIDFNTERNNLKEYYLRTLNSFLCFVFEKGNYVMQTNTEDALKDYMKGLFVVLQDIQFPFNDSPNWRIGMLSIFHPNVPEELVSWILENLPKGFLINARDHKGDSMATLVIKRYTRDFMKILEMFTFLEKHGFDFSHQTVSSDAETFLSVYVNKCGKAFDQMDVEGVLTADVAMTFFMVLHFLLGRLEEDRKKKNGQILVLSEAMNLNRCTIAVEFLKVYPTILKHMSASIVLNFIKKCPEVLEFLNSCPSCFPRNENEAERLNFIEFNHQHSPELIKKEWLTFVHQHHLQFIDLANKNPDEIKEQYIKAVELIYDYLIDVRIDSSNKAVTMNFDIFEPLEDTENKEDGCSSRQCKCLLNYDKRFNAELMEKILSTRSSLKEHCLYKEYFEKFYRPTLFISFLFIIIHLAFIINLNGCMMHVVTPVTNYAIDSQIYKPEHYSCHISNCTMQNLIREQRKAVYFPTKQNKDCKTISSVPRCLECPAYTTNGSLCSKRTKAIHKNCPFTMHLSNLWLSHGLSILLLFATVGMVKEILQLIVDFKDYCLEKFRNILETSMYLFSFLFALNFSNCPTKSGYKDKWQFYLGAIAAMNSWILMLLYMRCIAGLGVKVVMFTYCVSDGVKFFFTFWWLLIGFAVEFHLILGNQLVFRSIHTSVSRVWIMMTGEVEYKDFMTSQFENPDDLQTQVPYEWFSRIALLSFIFFIHIILLNLFLSKMVREFVEFEEKAQIFIIRYTESLDNYHSITTGLYEKLKGFCCPTNRRRQPIDPESGNPETGSPETGNPETGNPETGNSETGNHSLMGRNQQAEPPKDNKLYSKSLDEFDVLKWDYVASFCGFNSYADLSEQLRQVEERKKENEYKYLSIRGHCKPEDSEGSQVVIQRNPNGTEADVAIRQGKENAPAMQSEVAESSV